MLSLGQLLSSVLLQEKKQVVTVHVRLNPGLLPTEVSFVIDLPHVVREVTFCIPNYCKTW